MAEHIKEALFAIGLVFTCFALTGLLLIGFDRLAGGGCG